MGEDGWAASWRDVSEQPRALGGPHPVSEVGAEGQLVPPDTHHSWYRNPTAAPVLKAWCRARSSPPRPGRGAEARGVDG